MKNKKNHSGWIVALVLTFSLTAAGSAFADTWAPYQAGSTEFVGQDIGVATVEQSTATGSSKVVFTSFPAGVNCSSTANSAWIRAGSTEENRLVAIALMARAMNRTVNVSIQIVGGNICQLTTLQF